MYCEGTADILDAHGCGVDTHVFIYTHTPSAADSLRTRDGTQWFSWHIITYTAQGVAGQANRIHTCFIDCQQAQS